MRDMRERLILLVDDAEMCAVTLEIAFSDVPGLVVNTARTAEEAIAALSHNAVDAVVTDLHLPGMDGFELIARIRGDARLVDLPIIVISGDTDPRTPERVLALGANAFFLKPYSPAAVRRKVEQFLDV